MDSIARGQPFTIITDYAVTPAAFERVYETLPSINGSHDRKPRTIHIFGAAGERDRGKRPILGEIAGRNADLVILTDEDPYAEDPEQILDDIEQGLTEVGVTRAQLPFAGQVEHGVPEKSYLRIRDRREAIRIGLTLARPGDTVLVTGKGAEETLAVGDRRIPWNDRRAIEEELEILELQSHSPR